MPPLAPRCRLDQRRPPPPKEGVQCACSQRVSIDFEAVWGMHGRLACFRVPPDDRNTGVPLFHQYPTTITDNIGSAVILLNLCSRPSSPSCFLQQQFPSPPTPPPPPVRICASRIRFGRRSERFFSSSTCHLAMNRLAVSRISRYHLRAFFATWIHSFNSKL